MDFGSLGFTQNPYLEQQVQDALGDTTRAYNLAVQPAFNSAMVRSGSFGNSGVDQMNQEAQRQLQTTLGRQANDMRGNNFWQGLGFDAENFWKNQQFDKSVYDTTFAQNQQNLQNGLGLLGMMQGANTQSLGLGQQIQDAPMNYYNNFNQQANSIGQGYGTSNSSMSAQGSPLMGALGGYQLGSAFGKSMGFGAGTTGNAWSTGWGNAMNGTNGDVAYG